MRQFRLTTFFLLISVLANAQLSNMDFENWTTSGTINSWSEPTGWSSSNTLTDAFGAGVFSAIPSYSGDSSCALATLMIGFADAPAFIVNGKCDYDQQTFTPYFERSGTSINTAYHYLHGFYKYSSQAIGDSGFVMVQYRKWNSLADKSDTVLSVTKLLPPVNTYTEFQVDLTAIGNTSVDTVVIIFVSTNPAQILSGGILVVDDLSMDMINSTNDISTSADIKIYPNPAADIVNVAVGSNEFISHINIVDLTGKTVTSTDYYNTSEAKLEVANFKAGIYFVQVTTSKGIITRKLSVRK